MLVLLPPWGAVADRARGHLRSGPARRRRGRVPAGGLDARDVDQRAAVPQRPAARPARPAARAAPARGADPAPDPQRRHRRRCSAVASAFWLMSAYIGRIDDRDRQRPVLQRLGQPRALHHVRQHVRVGEHHVADDRRLGGLEPVVPLAALHGLVDRRARPRTRVAAARPPGAAVAVRAVERDLVRPLPRRPRLGGRRRGGPHRGPGPRVVDAAAGGRRASRCSDCSAAPRCCSTRASPTS